MGHRSIGISQVQPNDIQILFVGLSFLNGFPDHISKLQTISYSRNTTFLHRSIDIFVKEKVPG